MDVIGSMAGARWLVVLALVVPALGCTVLNTKVAYTYDKVGAQDQEMRVDWGLCGGAFNDAGVITNDGSADGTADCMLGKGYKRRIAFIAHNDLGFGHADKDAAAQRADWGLCGGGFGDGGKWLPPEDFEGARACMVQERGYSYLGAN